MACVGRLDMMRWGRFDSLVCVDWFSVWDLGHSDFSRYFDYDSWEACNFDSNFGINYEEDCGEWMFGRCVNGSAVIGTFGWDSLSADVGFGRECGCGVQLVTLECRVGCGLWSRNVVHNGDTSIPDASTSCYGLFCGGLKVFGDGIGVMDGASYAKGASSAQFINGRYDGRVDLYGWHENGIHGLRHYAWLTMDGCLLSGGGMHVSAVHGGCGGCLDLYGWLTSGASGLSNSTWLRTDVHNGDLGAPYEKHSGFDVVTMHLAEPEWVSGHGGDVDAGTADWFFLDGGSLEGPESHLWAVRTPANFSVLDGGITAIGCSGLMSAPALGDGSGGWMGLCGCHLMVLLVILGSLAILWAWSVKCRVRKGVSCGSNGLGGPASVERLTGARFECREVVRDRLAERIEQLSLRRKKVTQIDHWSMRQSRLWASGLGVGDTGLAAAEADWIMWEWWMELLWLRRVYGAECAAGAPGPGVEVSGVVPPPPASCCSKGKALVLVLSVGIGMLSEQMHMWLLLCWVVCDGLGWKLLFLLTVMVPGVHGMEGGPEDLADVVMPVAVVIAAGVGAQVVDGLPDWFDLSGWVFDLVEWEDDWGRLVEWAGDDHSACMGLVALELKLRKMYEWVRRNGQGGSLMGEVNEAVLQWEADTGDQLDWYGQQFQVDWAGVDHWAGQLLLQDPGQGVVRHMFLNVRHFKSGEQGTLDAQEIWDWCSEWSVKVAALSDHCLSAGVGPAGKWEVVGQHGLEGYRCSGHQARSARSWGGEGMQWTVAQGLPSSNGPGGGTLLAVADAQDRWDREVVDYRGWGRWAGKTVLGKMGTKLIVLTVYGPTRSDSSGSIWMQQSKRMKGILDGDRQQDPRQQFLYDLHCMLWKYVEGGWLVVLGGDFNMHWNQDLMGVVSSGGAGGYIKGLRQFAEALCLVDAMTEAGYGGVTTFKRSSGEGAAESTPDHLLISESLQKSGAVKGVSVWKGGGMRSTDHYPMVLDLDLRLPLLLDVSEEVPLPARVKVEKIMLDNDKKIGCFQQRVVELVQERGLEQKMVQIEQAVEELVQWQSGEWSRYGESNVDCDLQRQLDVWFSEMAVVVVEAEKDVSRGPQGKGGKHVGGRHQLWSEEFMQTKTNAKELREMLQALDKRQCQEARFCRWWDEVKGAMIADVDLGAGGVVAPVAGGRTEWREGWTGWVLWANAALKTLRKKSHVGIRRDIRAAVSSREKSTKLKVELNKWKGVLRKYLKRPYSSGDRRVLLVGSEEEGTRELVYEPEQVKEHLRLFFEAWMGKGKRLWYNSCGAAGDELHPLFADSADGRDLRRGLVRGTLTEEEGVELAESVPEFIREVLGWWKRKKVVVGGVERELEERDFLVNGVMEVTPEDWERWVSKKVGNKASDFAGVHINMMKAMMKPGCVQSEDEDALGSKGSRAPSPAVGALHLIRRGLQAILTTGLVADSCYDEVLCTVNKVMGSVDVNDTRPIGLIFLWRNMLMGIQFYKVMHTLEGLQALSRWQTGGRVGQGTDIALLEAQLIQEYCWMTDTELHRALEDKRRAYDSPSHQGGLDMAMDRMAIPYSLIMLSTKLDLGSRMRVRTAHGLSDFFRRWRGVVQGGEDSPAKWVIFDDPFCTKMEQLEAQGEGASMKVPFCKSVATSGKSFVDDKSYIAASHEEMGGKLVWAEKYNGFTGTEMKPSKGGVQSLVPCAGGYKKKDQLPDLSVTLFEDQVTQVIPRYEADEPMKYLGVLSTLLLSWGWSVDEATELADRIALCIRTGSSMAEVSHRLMTTVAAPAVLYKLMVASVGQRDMQDIQSKCYVACKAAIGLAKTTPNEVVGATVSLDWWNMHCVQQLLMVMKMLLGENGLTKHMLCSSLRMRQLWSGTALSGLGGGAAMDRGWDGTMLGRLHLWMSEHGFEVKGGGRLPDGRVRDIMLTSLASGVDRGSEEELIAMGAWRADMWRLSDILRLDGKTLGRGLRTSDGVIKKIVKAEGKDAAGWCDLLKDKLGVRNSVVSRQFRLGIRCRGSIHLHGRVVLVVDGLLLLGEVVADDGDGLWEDLVTVRSWKKVGGEAGRGSDRAACGWLYDPDQWEERVVVAGSLVKVQVVEHGTGLVELDESLEAVDAALQGGRLEAVGCNSSPSWDFPAKKRIEGWAKSVKHNQESWEGLMMEVDPLSYLPGEVKLMAVSDGSLRDAGYQASATCGWVVYGYMIREKEYSWGDGVVAAGGSAVHGERRWLTSQRAELQGLLSVLIAIEQSGWKGSVVLRLDNEAAAVSGGEVSFENPGVDEWLLADTDRMADSDLINEIAAWKTKYSEGRRGGEGVTVRWQRGHPEKHKRADKADWSVHDHGIYEADLIADEFHTPGGSVPEYDVLSHDAQWVLWWRGVRLVGQLRSKVVEAMRIELIAMYMAKVAGDGQHESWVCVPSAAALVAKKGYRLSRRVLRAKVLAGILGTQDTKLLRGHVPVNADLRCRMCGMNWETVNHVLWECTHVSVAVPRAELVDRLMEVCGTLDEGARAVVTSVWMLGSDGAVMDADWTTLRSNLESGGETQDERQETPLVSGQSPLTDILHKLDAALVKRSADPTELYADRVGLLGPRWLEVLQSLGVGTTQAEQLLHGISRTLHEEKGMSKIWDGFCERLESQQVDCGRRYVHQTDADGFVWDRIQAIRETLEPDWHSLFEKLDWSQDGVVWRAWLREYEVQLSALETEHSAAGKAFEFAQALRKAGRLTGKKGKHGRRVVREVALAAELLQRQGVFYYDCPQYDFKYLHARFIEEGVISAENVSGASGEGEGGGVARQAAVGAGGESEPAAGGGVGQVVVCPTVLSAGEVQGSGSVLGMGSSACEGGDEAREGPQRLGGTAGRSPGNGQCEEERSGGCVGHYSADEGPESADECFGEDVRDERGRGNGTTDGSGGAFGLAECEKSGLQRQGRVWQVQRPCGGSHAAGRVRGDGGVGPDGRRLVAGVSQQGQKPRGSTSGSIRQLQKERKAESEWIRAEGGSRLRGRDSECAHADRRVRPAVHPARCKEMGLFGGGGGVGGECGVGLRESDWGTGRHVGANKGSSRQAVVDQIGGATRHSSNGLDESSVQDVLKRRRVEHVEGLGLQGPQSLAQAAIARSMHQVWEDSAAGRRIGQVVDASGSFVVEGVTWPGVVSGEPSGQPGTERIHGRVLGARGGADGGGRLLRLRQTIQEVDAAVEQSAAVGATGADGEWSMSREREVPVDGGQQAPQDSSRWWRPGPRQRVSGRQVGGAAGAHGGAGGGSEVECRGRVADGGVDGQQGTLAAAQAASGGGSQQAIGGGGQQAVSALGVASLRRDKRPADWSGESGRQLRVWIGSAFVRKRPGVAADRMAARRRKAANGRVDCWSVLERGNDTSQVVQHRPQARDEIRRVMRMGSGHESDED